MDIATLVGLIAGIGVIAGAVTQGSNFLIYLNLPGFLIVVGGTAAAVLIKFPLKICIESFVEGLKTAFIDRSEQPMEIVRIATHLADIVRKQGKLALEHTPVKNHFFRKGIQLIVDGHKPEFVRKVMTMEMDQSVDRHLVGERVFRAIGESAPAFGMLGTLVGLVQMLTQLDDPSKIGMGMAVALLTTLYGSLIANLIALPIADKLQMRALAEHSNKELIMESLMSIERGENPRLMEEVLFTYLPNHQRELLNGNAEASRARSRS